MLKFNHLFVIVLLAFAGAVSMVSSTGCANIAPPTGGPRDSLPPKLVRVIPGDSARGFNARKVVFEFNEYVQIDNIQQNLLVSPTPKINPNVTNKLKTVTVAIKDTLEPNTTYVIEFGKGIKDVNEGNVLENFSYVFSTGSTIDSLEISGNVMVAETGLTDSTLIVVLHQNLDDSAVIKERPRYVTKLSPKGEFRFHHLPPGTFAIYAMKDEGGQRKYMTKSQLFAFADKHVNTTENNNITLYAYQERDTTSPKKPATPPKPAKADKDKKLRAALNLNGDQFGLLDTMRLSFNQAPLSSFDSSKIILADDKGQPLSGFNIVRDTSNKFASLFYNWAENTPYKLILQKGYATDTLGNEAAKSDTIPFRTKKNSEYGTVQLKFINLDLAQNPVLQFVQGNQVKYSHVFTNRDFKAKLFTPGDYDLRILFDANKNGVWDPGEFFGKHIQPEKVLAVSRKVTIKANWDNEIDITL